MTKDPDWAVADHVVAPLVGGDVTNNAALSEGSIHSTMMASPQRAIWKLCLSELFGSLSTEESHELHVMSKLYHALFVEDSNENKGSILLGMLKNIGSWSIDHD